MKTARLALALLALAPACVDDAQTAVDAARRADAVTPTDVANPDVANPDVVAMDAAVDVAATDATTDVPVDVAPDGTADAGCFVGTPRTRLEFLNRCTDAEVATKAVVLPLLRGDGTLPPLP